MAARKVKLEQPEDTYIYNAFQICDENDARSLSSRECPYLNKRGIGRKFALQVRQASVTETY